MNSSNDSWGQLRQDFDVYRFYMDFILKFAMFVFAITGGMLSYYLGHAEQSILRYALLLPLVFNLALSVMCFWALAPASTLIDDQERLARNAGVVMPYDMRPLRHLLILFGLVFGLVAAGLTFLFFWDFRS